MFAEFPRNVDTEEEACLGKQRTKIVLLDILARRHINLIKGTVSHDIWRQFFHESSFHPSPWSFKNFRKFAEIFASQGAPPVSTANLPPCQLHRWQIYKRYQQHRRQFLPPVLLVLLIPVTNLPPVLTIPVANLPLVSTTLVANNGINIRLLTP